MFKMCSDVLRCSQMFSDDHKSTVITDGLVFAKSTLLGKHVKMKTLKLSFYWKILLDGC